MSVMEYVKGNEGVPFLVQISRYGTNISRAFWPSGLSLVSLSDIPSPEDLKQIVQLGTPCIDWRSVPESDAPLSQGIPVPIEDARHLPFSADKGAPKEVVATMASVLGAMVYNIELINLHPKMFGRMTQLSANVFCSSLPSTVQDSLLGRGAHIDFTSTDPRLQALMTVCQDFVAEVDAQREHCEQRLRQQYEERDFESDLHLEAVSELNRLEMLDSLISHYWSYCVYHGLLVTTNSKSVENALRDFVRDVTRHLEEQMVKFGNLDSDAYSVQQSAVKTLSEKVEILVSTVEAIMRRSN